MAEVCDRQSRLFRRGALNAAGYHHGTSRADQLWQIEWKNRFRHPCTYTAERDALASMLLALLRSLGR